MALPAVTRGAKRYVRSLEADYIWMSLTQTEQRLYDALLAANGRLVTHDALLAAMYGEQEQFDSSHRSQLKIYVYRLRHLKGVEITNVRSIGYALAPLSVCPACGGPLRRLPA